MENKPTIPVATNDSKPSVSEPQLCLPATDTTTKPTPKKRKARSAICCYRGCGVFGDTVNSGGCPAHYLDIKTRQAANKRAERATNAGKPIDLHPFKLQRNVQVLKVASHYKHVYAPALDCRALLFALYEGNLYDSLREHEIEIYSNMFTISTELMNYITGRWNNNDYKHQQLFASLKKWNHQNSF
jgi:hypothetical protein